MTVHGTHCDNVSSQPFNCSSEFLNRLATSSSAPEDNNTSDVPRRGAEDKERKGVPNTTHAEEYTSEQEEAVKRYHDDLVLLTNHIHRSFVLGYRDSCTLHFSSVRACPISVLVVMYTNLGYHIPGCLFLVAGLTVFIDSIFISVKGLLRYEDN